MLIEYYTKVYVLQGESPQYRIFYFLLSLNSFPRLSFKDFSMLPNLTPKQQNFVMQYITNGNNATEAYRQSYDVKKMDSNAIYIEASRLLKNPKVSQWIDFYQSNIQQNFKEKSVYTAELAMQEYDNLKGRVSKNIKYCNVEKSIIDSKCKLAGLLTDKIEHNAGATLADFLDKLD